MERTVDNLYIIGNGFDIHHNIKCKFSDFHDYLCVHNPMLENRLFQVYDLHYGDLWSSLEKNLGIITAESILGGYVYAPMILFLERIDGDFTVLNMDDYSETVGEIGYTLTRLYTDLKYEFSRWASQLNNADIKQRVIIEKNKSSFISFNYTRTLEYIYSINSSDIFYIHGCAERNDDLFFGHNMTSARLLNNWEDNYSIEELDTLLQASEEMAILYKDVKSIIDKNELYWESIKSAKKVHVWGLSLSEVDVPYIEHINSILNDKCIEWEFSWFLESDRNRIHEIVRKCQIQNYSLITLNELMLPSYKGGE